jgi:hypothetical protein
MRVMFSFGHAHLQLCSWIKAATIAVGGTRYAQNPASRRSATPYDLPRCSTIDPCREGFRFDHRFNVLAICKTLWEVNLARLILDDENWAQDREEAKERIDGAQA